MDAARKNDSEKLRVDLIPVGPLKNLADVYTKGAKKYGDNNWRKGMKWSRFYGALIRHILEWWDGEEYDKEDGQHHLDSVAFCAFALREYVKTHPEFDDRPSNTKNTGSVPTDAQQMKGQLSMYDKLFTKPEGKQKLCQGTDPADDPAWGADIETYRDDCANCRSQKLWEGGV